MKKEGLNVKCQEDKPTVDDLIEYFNDKLNDKNHKDKIITNLL